MTSQLSLLADLDVDEGAALAARRWRVARTAYLAPACWLVPNRLDPARFDAMARMFGWLRRAPAARVPTAAR